MAQGKHPIYLATVLLERNRWAAGRRPSYRVSDWLHRFQQDGFDGLELWENHLALADEAERQRLFDSSLPVVVYNSYASMDDSGADARTAASNLATRLGAQGVKFNLGAAPERWQTYVGNALAWADDFPEPVQLLCECHGGTVVETPEAARQAFDLWPEPRFGAIVHPFSLTGERLQAWFNALGSRIVHAHVQVRSGDGQLVRLRSRETFVREQLALLSEVGFAGSFTLEFAEGTGTAQEDIEALYTAALDDLAFLREQLG